MRKSKQALSFEDRLAARERKATLQKWNADATPPSMPEASLPAVQAGERIIAGQRREYALRIYTATVNQEDTLFSFNETLLSKLAQMRALLHDPITADEAYALNDVLYGRQAFIDMIAWLQNEPIAWDGYFAREKFRADEADRKLGEYLKRQDEDWAKGVGDYAPGRRSEKFPELAAAVAKLAGSAVELAAKAKAGYLKDARPCQRCGTPPELLEWSQHSSPPSCWRTICSGWRTQCKFCLIEVNFFIDTLGSGRRPTIPGGKALNDAVLRRARGFGL